MRILIHQKSNTNSIQGVWGRHFNLSTMSRSSRPSFVFSTLDLDSHGFAFLQKASLEWTSDHSPIMANQFNTPRQYGMNSYSVQPIVATQGHVQQCSNKHQGCDTCSPISIPCTIFKTLFPIEVPNSARNKTVTQVRIKSCEDVSEIAG